MQIFRGVVAIMAALIAATGITLDTLQIIGIETKWWTLGAFIIFSVFVIWIIVGLYIKNRELEEQHPSINVKRFIENSKYYLEVTNNGATGTFKAQIKILVGKEYLKNNISQYWACWEYGKGWESKILRGQNDYIQIASLITKKPQITKYLEIPYYDYSTSTSIITTTGYYEPKVTIVNLDTRQVKAIEYPKPIIKFKAIISADPSLKEKEVTKTFILNMSGLHEIPPYKIRLIKSTKDKPLPNEKRQGTKR